MSKANTEMPAGAALSLFDAAKYLHTPEEISASLEAVFEDYGGDARVVVKTLGAVAKAMVISREGLH
jgi:DNA-binding phage protein